VDFQGRRFKVKDMDKLRRQDLRVSDEFRKMLETPEQQRQREGALTLFSKDEPEESKDGLDS